MGETSRCDPWTEKQMDHETQIRFQTISFIVKNVQQVLAFFIKPSSGTGTGITSTLYTKHCYLKRKEWGVSFTDIHIDICYILATKHTEINSLSFGQYVKHTYMNISKTEISSNVLYMRSWFSHIFLYLRLIMEVWKRWNMFWTTKDFLSIIHQQMY